VDSLPKYSLLEIERRWLVNTSQVGPLDQLPARRIEDLYISGTRLRLRKMESPDGSVVYKLAKKYGARDGCSEPITNLYLTSDEHGLLSRLTGSRVEKTRYSILGGALDVYTFPHSGLAIFEHEFPTEEAARTYLPPPFVTEEVTHQPALLGCGIGNQ